MTARPRSDAAPLCRRCGESVPDGPDAAHARERLASALKGFVDARIPIVAERLSKGGRRRFLAMPHGRQAAFVLYLVGRGALR